MLVVVGLELVIFVVKEGLVLINGIDGMFGMFVFVVYDFDVLFWVVDVVVVMSVEVLFGIDWLFVDDLMVLCLYLG